MGDGRLICDKVGGDKYWRDYPANYSKEQPSGVTVHNNIERSGGTNLVPESGLGLESELSSQPKKLQSKEGQPFTPSLSFYDTNHATKQSQLNAHNDPANPLRGSRYLQTAINDYRKQEPGKDSIAIQVAAAEASLRCGEFGKAMDAMQDAADLAIEQDRYFNQAETMYDLAINHLSFTLSARKLRIKGEGRRYEEIAHTRDEAWERDHLLGIVGMLEATEAIVAKHDASDINEANPTAKALRGFIYLLLASEGYSQEGYINQAAVLLNNYKHSLPKPSAFMTSADFDLIEDYTELLVEAFRDIYMGSSQEHKVQVASDALQKVHALDLLSFERFNYALSVLLNGTREEGIKALRSWLGKEMTPGDALHRPPITEEERQVAWQALEVAEAESAELEDDWMDDFHLSNKADFYIKIGQYGKARQLYEQAIAHLYENIGGQYSEFYYETRQQDYDKHLDEINALIQLRQRNEANDPNLTDDERLQFIEKLQQEGQFKRAETLMTEMLTQRQWLVKNANMESFTAYRIARFSLNQALLIKPGNDESSFEQLTLLQSAEEYLQFVIDQHDRLSEDQEYGPNLWRLSAGDLYMGSLMNELAVVRYFIADLTDRNYDQAIANVTQGLRMSLQENEPPFLPITAQLFGSAMVNLRNLETNQTDHVDVPVGISWIQNDPTRMHWEMMQGLAVHSSNTALALKHYKNALYDMASKVLGEDGVFFVERKQREEELINIPISY